MTKKQQSQITMYEAVLRFLTDAGAPLLAVAKIALSRDALAALVVRLKAAGVAQDQNTTGITNDRNTVKLEAAQKAEILRLLVVALAPDATLRKELKAPLSKVVKSKEVELLKYLGRIDEAVGTFGPEELQQAGYDPQVRLLLQKNLKALTLTQGAARQVEAGVKVATETLLLLFEEITRTLETQLDPFVKAQQLVSPELVLQYEAVRRIMKSAGRRSAEYRGKALFGTPTLVYDRREAGVPTPTLGNRSSRGLTLRYYTAPTSTALPESGQGLTVKNKEEVRLPDYSKLGAENAPYLLVMQEQLDGEGKWVVR